LTSSPVLYTGPSNIFISGIIGSGISMEIPPEPTHEERFNEDGIDRVKLRYNLSLTVDQRVEQHYRACQSLLELISAAQSAGYSQAGRRPREK